MTRRLILALLLTLTTLTTLTPPAHAGTITAIAWKPWRDGSSIVGGGKATWSSGGKWKLTCKLQRFQDSWWQAATWYTNAERTVEGYGPILVGLRAPHRTGIWRTRCVGTAGRYDTTTVTSYRIAL